MSETAQTRAQVFIVRVWYEAQEPGECDVRIQARHVLSGETRYFMEWPALTAYLAGKVDAASPSPGDGIERTRSLFVDEGRQRPHYSPPRGEI